MGDPRRFSLFADVIAAIGGRIKKFRHKQNAGRRLDGREHNAMPGDAT